MSNKSVIPLQGEITEALPNAMFRVQIDEGEHEDFANREILCTLNGKMRMYRIRVMPGDKVKVEATPYDLNKGRITFRLK